MNRRNRLWSRLIALALATAIIAIFGTTIYAQEEVAEATNTFAVQIDTLWVLVAGFLVFFMQAGFSLLEAGLIRQTGVVNSLMENFMDAAVTGIMFWAIGFGIAFGTSAGGLVGTSNFFLSEAIILEDGAVTFATFDGLNISILAMFFFQFAFAATASTIATGAMAERTNFIAKIIYSVVVGAFIYPIVVHWVWGGGWISELGFVDFAGSTVVHATGGIVALIGAAMVGPRVGRVFGEGAPAGHNMSMAALGTLILWLGWYGFNPGSTLGMGDPDLVGLVTVNTTLAAAAGAVATMLFMYLRTRKWDLAFTLNGSLAGLVGITAGCATVMPWAAAIIGGIAGIVVVLAIDVMEKIKIDDAVGAFAVHGACGIFGTLMIGFVGQPELGAGGLLLGGGIDVLIAQIIGVAAVVTWVSLTSLALFTALKVSGLLRVSTKADEIGIDLYEHGASLWPDVLSADEKIAEPAPAVGD